jgi:cytochrome bd-type quinol oxidase subunit 2
MKKLKNYIISIAASGLLAVPILSFSGVAFAQANIQQGLDRGTCLSTTDTNCDTADPDDTINNIITTVINIFSLIVGVVSVIMIIIGGLKYITSGGDSGNVTGAKNTILYAVIGLVIVALAQVIVRFVLGRVTDTTS